VRKRSRQIRKKALEERIVRDKALIKIRDAAIGGDRNRCMVEARKAGYTFRLIGMAAGVTRQRAQTIASKECH
jgi:hypothetical protein